MAPMTPLDAESLVDMIRKLAQATEAFRAIAVEQAGLMRRFLVTLEGVTSELRLARDDRRRISAIESQVAALVEDERERQRIRDLVDEAAEELATPRKAAE